MQSEKKAGLYLFLQPFVFQNMPEMCVALLLSGDKIAIIQVRDASARCYWSLQSRFKRDLRHTDTALGLCKGVNNFYSLQSFRLKT